MIGSLAGMNRALNLRFKCLNGSRQRKQNQQKTLDVHQHVQSARPAIGNHVMKTNGRIKRRNTTNTADSQAKTLADVPHVPPARTARASSVQEKANESLHAFVAHVVASLPDSLRLRKAVLVTLLSLLPRNYNRRDDLNILLYNLSYHIDDQQKLALTLLKPLWKPSVPAQN